jgi:hypothetical protein
MFCLTSFFFFQRLYTNNNANLAANARRARLQSQTASISGTRFGFFNSFLYLTFNPIMKYHHQSESASSPYRKIGGILRKDTRSQSKPATAGGYRKRALTTTTSPDRSGIDFSPRINKPPSQPRSQPLRNDRRRRHSLATSGNSDGPIEVSESRRQRVFSTEQWLYNQDTQRSTTNNVTILTGTQFMEPLLFFSFFFFNGFTNILMN